MTLAASLLTFQDDLKKVKDFVHGSSATDIVTEGGTIPSLAKLAKTITVALLLATTTLSTSSVPVALGERTFIIEEDKFFQPNQWVTASAGATQGVTGKVVSHVGTTLKINVLAVIGTGTASNWTISLSGQPGTGIDIPTETNLSKTVTATSSIIIPANTSAWFIANDSAADVWITKAPTAVVGGTLQGSFVLMPRERITSKELPGSGAVSGIIAAGTANVAIWSA